MFYMKLQPRTLIIVSGLIWFAIGLWLLNLGINFLVEASKDSRKAVLLFSESALFIFLAAALLVGFFKGKFVLAKTVERNTSRLQNASTLGALFTPAYLILIAVMVCLGFLVRYLPLDIRGFVDVAIGAALLNGAMLYFRKAKEEGGRRKAE